MKNKDRTLYKHRDVEEASDCPGWWEISIEGNGCSSLLIKVSDFVTPRPNLYFADEEQVRKIRDTLTKWLGDE